MTAEAHVRAQEKLNGETDSDSDDDADAKHLAELGNIIFLPGLRQWAMSTMGFTAAQVFRAWRLFVKNFGGNQQRIGAEVDAVLGQYVVPNRSCDPQIEKDSGGLAGRISRIIRCDGSIESASNEAVEIGGTRQENAEEGREIVFVEWAVNSIERGGYLLPNKWSLLMSGRNLGDDDREDQQQQFPLCLASEDAIDQAKDEMMARKFQQELRDIPIAQNSESPEGKKVRTRSSRLFENQALDSDQTLEDDGNNVELGSWSNKRPKKKLVLQRGGLTGMTVSSILKHCDVSIHDTISAATKEMARSTSDGSSQSSLNVESLLSATRKAAAVDSVVQSPSSSGFSGLVKSRDKEIPSKRTADENVNECKVQSPQVHEKEVTITDFFKKSFMESNFMAKPLTKPDFRRQIRYKELIPSPPLKRQSACKHIDQFAPLQPRWNLSLSLTAKHARLQARAQKAKDFLQKTQALKKVRIKQSKRQLVDFHCRIAEESDLRFLPQVVAANPGWPKSILIVSPMNETMSIHQTKDLTAEMRHLQTSTLCVRDMLDPLDVEDLFETVKTSMPMALQTTGTRLLTNLCLVRVILGPSTISYLCQSILEGEHCRLKHLFCKSNNLGDLGATKIARSLSKQDSTSKVRNGVASTLVSLWLDQNEIHDKGATDLGNAIAEHPTLEIVSLSKNHITDKGAVAMTVVVKKNSTLKQLNLTDNLIVGPGNDALHQASRESDAVAENLTIICGTQIQPRVPCRARYPQVESQVDSSGRSPNIVKAQAPAPCVVGETSVEHRDVNQKPIDNTIPQSPVPLRAEATSYCTKEEKQKPIDKGQLYSKRDKLLEESKVLDKRKTKKREEVRNQRISAVLIEHAGKMQDNLNSKRFISDIAKNLSKLHNSLETIKKEKKRGWKLLVERTENDIEWFVREQVRRERQLEQAKMDMRKDVVRMLYQRSLILKQEDIMKTRFEPTLEFVRDLDIICSEVKAEDSTEVDEFPPKGAQQAFLFDPSEIHRGLELEAQSSDDAYGGTCANAIITYRSSTGECDWSTALLEPKLPFGTASFVEFLIMEQPTNLKNCNMLFGITKDSYSVQTKAPFLEDSGIMFFPRRGRVYMDGQVVHTFAQPVVLQNHDKISMLVDAEQSMIIFYHTRNGIRREVGDLKLQQFEGFAQKPWSMKHFRWAVTLGSPGQKVEAHSARMHLRSTFAEKCKETPLPSHVKDMASVPGIDVENNVDSDESEQQSHHQEDQGAHEPMREDESLAGNNLIRQAGGARSEFLRLMSESGSEADDDDMNGRQSGDNAYP